MPVINWTDNTPEGRKRDEEIKNLLPKEPIVSDFLDAKVLNTNKKKLIEILKQEIEVYRAYPNKERYEVEKFNPRNSRECFMGQAFKYNGHGFEGWTSGDLERYRKAIGTIPHGEWGDATLLEIWAGDHFEKHSKMVTDVFRYGHGELNEMPKVDFYVNPFYKNSKSGKWDADPDELAQKAYRQHLEKIAIYIEIRDRLKKAGIKNPMELAVDPKDDPKKKRRTNYGY